MKMDIVEGIELLHENGVAVDMVFIDSEKHTESLLSLIFKIKTYFPSAVIVGDDNVFQSVKDAVRILREKHHFSIIERNESFLIIPTGCTVNVHNILTNLKQSFKPYSHEIILNRLSQSVKNQNMDELVEIMGVGNDMFKFMGKSNNGVLTSFDNPHRSVSKFFMLCHACVKLLKHMDDKFKKQFVELLVNYASSITIENSPNLWVSSSIVTPFDLLTYGVNFE